MMLGSLRIEIPKFSFTAVFTASRLSNSMQSLMKRFLFVKNDSMRSRPLAGYFPWTGFVGVILALAGVMLVGDALRDRMDPRMRKFESATGLRIDMVMRIIPLH